MGGREDLRVLGGAASPTASGRACKQERSGKKRRAGPAGGQGPGRPACRGSGPAPPRLGEGSETQRPISKAAWSWGLARPGPPSPYSGCLPSPPRSVQCLESAGDRDAPGNGGESCIGATQTPLGMERSGKEPFRERQKPRVLRPPGKQEEKYCKGTWDLRWPWTPALGMESPTAAYAACPHICNCTDEGTRHLRAQQAPGTRGSLSTLGWALATEWESLVPGHPLEVSRALLWGCVMMSRGCRNLPRRLRHPKYKTMGFL